MMETIYQMRKRHKAERFELLQTAVRATRSAADAAKLLQMHETALYREFREAGTTVKAFLREQEQKTEKGAT